MKPIVEESLAVHEAFRRLGFPADDIFVAVNGPLKGNKRQISIVLRSQGQEFVCIIGLITESRDEFIVAWNAGIDNWNGNWSESKRQEVWEASNISRQCLELCISLVSKGFVIPHAKYKQVN